MQFLTTTSEGYISLFFTLALMLVLLYLFFGRSTRKERLISRKGYARLSKRPMAAYQCFPVFILMPSLSAI